MCAPSPAAKDRQSGTRQHMHIKQPLTTGGKTGYCSHNETTSNQTAASEYTISQTTAAWKGYHRQVGCMKQVSWHHFPQGCEAVVGLNPATRHCESCRNAIHVRTEVSARSHLPWYSQIPPLLPCQHYGIHMPMYAQHTAQGSLHNCLHGHCM